jgi:probable HAF family extracellular repeat protein
MLPGSSGLLRALLLLFVCSLGAQVARGQNYSVINLGSTGSWVPLSNGINASGQVVVADYIGGTTRAFFYDGSTIRNIGSLGGSVTIPRALNGLGHVVGTAYTAGGQYHAFSWTQAGGIVDLGTLGGSFSESLDINASGQMVGYSELADGTHAFSWTQAGGIVDLGTLGGTWSYPYDINASGQVVGYSYTAGGQPHAFSWTQAGGIVDLGTLGGSASYSFRVSDPGRVFGFSLIAGNGSYHAFSWTPVGGMVDLGTLGGVYSQVLMNASDQAVGISYTVGGQTHAFSWTQAGGMVDLGSLGGNYSYPIAVNASGQVVGISYTAGGQTHAFSWTQAGGMVDLGSLGGDYSFPYAISTSGQVVGTSLTGAGGYHAFLWTQTGGMIDLNSRIPTAPAGLELGQAIAVSDNGSIVVYGNTGTVLLKEGSSSSAAPALGPISANDPAAASSLVSVNANFADADTADTHTAVWTWGDNSPAQAGSVLETGGSGTVSGSHAFSAPGIYPVSLTVTDSSGRTATVSRDVVVYDPAAGYVTGSGWINSPAGAYKKDETLAGRATFGFVSKYQKGATVPTGNTEFQFHAARLNFHSENYSWLVVAGARAQYKGVGTINGLGSYDFLLTAVDGQINGGGGVDRFRIKIWYYDATLQQDVVVYDNQIDSSTIGTANEGTELGGGSIVIHTRL